MNFTPRLFDPVHAGGEAVAEDGSVLFRAGRRPEDLYVYSPRILLAVNVALATGRPLLVSGEPGSGKSSLARNVAGVLRRWYYHTAVTSRMEASDLLWSFDTLRRLNDANLTDDALKPDQYYVEPGTLWWAFNPARAVHRGRDEIDPGRRAEDPGWSMAADGEPDDRAVVLLDEIDKADPDVPNDLLEPLDLRRFRVRETEHWIEAVRDTFVILTTNGERELPPAFMRRCVSITLERPTREWFRRIADRKFGEKELHDQVADKVMRYRAAAERRGVRKPSTAEYLDALRVCEELEIDTESDVWNAVAVSVLWKHARPPTAEELESGDGGAIG